MVNGVPTILGDEGKYQLTDKYRLHVLNISYDDEGGYNCRLSEPQVAHDFYLTAAGCIPAVY